jgi:hypothetical protein
MISANLAREPYPVYPLGLTMVAESARKKGHEVFDWDHLMHKGSCEALQNFIDKQNPDFVGISLRNIDSVNFNEQKSHRCTDYSRWCRIYDNSRSNHGFS